MTTGDKVVLAVGLMTCFTMIVSGWIGEKTFAAYISPQTVAEVDAEGEAIHESTWRMTAACTFMFIEGLSILFLCWRFSRHVPMTLLMVMEVNLAFVSMMFAILIPILKTFAKAVKGLLTANVEAGELFRDQFEFMKVMATAIDKKAAAPAKTTKK